jgi:hypothetical protein
MEPDRAAAETAARNRGPSRPVVIVIFIVIVALALAEERDDLHRRVAA